MKEFLYATCFLLVGIVLGYGAHTLYVLIYYPPQADRVFVHSCGELNGKTLTYENVKSLDSICTVKLGTDGVTAKKCSQKLIDEYTTFVNQCKKYLPEKNISLDYNTMIHDSNYSNYLKCVHDFKQDATKEVWINEIGILSLSKDRPFDSTWQCHIYGLYDPIKAVPNYYRD